jgi:hypothetical protein
MADESLFVGGTMRERFAAVLGRTDETAAQRLDPLLPGPEGLHEQREEAWDLLTHGVKWAAEALCSVGIEGTDESPIRDADAAFNRAQHLDGQMLTLGLRDGYRDEVALLVDSVKLACYHGADLGPLPGGRIGSFRAPGESPRAVTPIEPRTSDLQAIGAALGEALVRFGELGLGDPLLIVLSLLRPVATASR